MGLKIPNYHVNSQRYEQDYENELLVYLASLIEQLNNIDYLTVEEINRQVELWKLENNITIDHINKSHIRRLINYTNEITDTVSNQNELDKFTKAYHDMFNITVDNIRNKFIELSVLENTYNYDDQASTDFINAIISTTNHSTQTFVQQSTTATILALLFDIATDEGYTEYKWQTQEDLRVRPSHAAMNGRWVKIDEAPSITGHKHAGEDYNCFPGDSLITFGDTIKGSFKRWYTGKILTITTESGNILKSTLNHPMLTTRGWVSANELQIGDYLVEVFNIDSIRSDDHFNQNYTTIAEVFETFRFATYFGKATSITSTNVNFHGEHVVNEDVDIITSDSSLTYNSFKDIQFPQFKNNIFFKFTNMPFFNTCQRIFMQSFLRKFNSCNLCYSIFSKAFKFLRSTFSKSNNISIPAISNSNVLGNKITNDSPSRNVVFLGQTENANTRPILINQSGIILKVDSIAAFAANNPLLFKDSSNDVFVTIERTANVLNAHSIGIQFTRITDKSFSYFTGHVYNLSTKDEFYVMSNIITHNCRCYAIEFR